MIRERLNEVGIEPVDNSVKDTTFLVIAEGFLIITEKDTSDARNRLS